MKTFSLAVFAAVILSVCGVSAVRSQTTGEPAGSPPPATLKELNSFVKKAFAKDSKFQERKMLVDKSRTILENLKNSLDEFKGCDIRFTQSIKSSAEESSLQTDFSLRKIIPEETVFIYNDEEMTITFRSEPRSIFFRYSASFDTTAGKQAFRESRGQTHIYTIKMKPAVHPSQIKSAVLKAIELCRS